MATVVDSIPPELFHLPCNGGSTPRWMSQHCRSKVGMARNTALRDV